MEKRIIFSSIIIKIFLCGSAFAEETKSCRTIFDTKKIAMRQCEGEKSKNEIVVELRSGRITPVRFIAETGMPTETNFFFSLRSEPAGSALSLADKRLLKEIFADRGGGLFPEARVLLGFLANFAEADLPIFHRAFPPRPAAVYTMLCDKIGKRKTGYFTVAGRKWKGRAVVGSNECIGRCGEGCPSFAEIGVYTQECFNHDLCRRTTGRNLDECEDEFWEAADGFLNAPSCE